MIQKGKLQQYVKKGEYSKFRSSNKNQHESSSRSDDHPFQPPQDVIKEIRRLQEDPSQEGHSDPLRKHA